MAGLMSLYWSCDNCSAELDVPSTVKDIAQAVAIALAAGWLISNSMQRNPRFEDIGPDLCPHCLKLAKGSPDADQDRQESQAYRG